MTHWDCRKRHTTSVHPRCWKQNAEMKEALRQENPEGTCAGPASPVPADQLWTPVICFYTTISQVLPSPAASAWPPGVQDYFPGTGRARRRQGVRTGSGQEVPRVDLHSLPGQQVVMADQPPYSSCGPSSHQLPALSGLLGPLFTPPAPGWEHSILLSPGVPCLSSSATLPCLYLSFFFF